jgi:hypothetical protein
MSRETDEKIKEMVQSIKEFSRESEAMGRRMDESKRELDRQMGKLNNSFGNLVEHLVAPGIREKFEALGYEFDYAATAEDYRLYDPAAGKVLAEIDLLLQNSERVMAVEVKAKLRQGDITDHIERLEVLRAWADRHQDRRRIYGAMAGAIVQEDVRRQVLRAGLYLIVQTGDTMKIDIPPNFVPRQW